MDIEYLTPFLRTKIIQLDIEDVNEFEILNSNWLAEYPTSININYKKSFYGKFTLYHCCHPYHWMAFRVVCISCR